MRWILPRCVLRFCALPLPWWPVIGATRLHVGVWGLLRPGEDVELTIGVIGATAVAHRDVELAIGPKARSPPSWLKLRPVSRG